MRCVLPFRTIRRPCLALSALAVALSLPLPAAAADKLPGAAGSQASSAAAVPDLPVLPLEARILPEPPTASKRVAARNVSIAGAAAGIILTGWGISLVFGGIAEGPDSRGVHRGIAVAVSGGLAASVFSAAAAYYSGPPER